MSEWEEYILEEIIDKFIDYRGKTPQKTITGIPLVTAKIVKSGRILLPTEFIDEDDYDEWMTRGLPEINDVVLTTEAPLGEVALIKDKKIALAQRIITLRGNKKIVFNPFLKYYFQSTKGQHELTSRASGTTVFGIKASVLRKVPVLLPPLPEQQAIAEVLTSLDDKIDLLHRQNQTLEQMAGTLFRQWFVEEAQEDWEEGKLGELIKIGSGKGLKKDRFVDCGKYPVLGANGEIGRTNEYLFDDRLIYTGRVGTLGNVFRIENEKVWLSDNTLIIKPKKYYNFVYFILKNSKLGQYNVGSTQPLVRQSDIKEIDIILLRKDTHIEFEKQSDIFFEKIKYNQSQIQTLEKLRDTLLPKLMSGEIKFNME